MRILITGGAGFIGSHLAERCLSEGWTVSILDDLSTGSLENVQHLRGHPGFSFCIDTVFNASIVSELVDRADLVFHLAAAVGVRLLVESPVRTIETNVRGTEVVLAAAAKKSTPIFLASTSEVYGKSTDFPFREDSDLLLGSTSHSRWGYACSKILDEFLGLAYYAERSLPVSVVRFFNTVGPRQTGQYGMVLPNFVRQALANEPITVHGDGEQSRCFAYVGDVVEALIRLVKSGKGVGQVVNIGSNEEISINALAKLVVDVTGSKSNIVHLSYDEAYNPGFEDILRRIPCLEKLERLTDYRPTTPIRKIIELMVPDHSAGASK